MATCFLSFATNIARCRRHLFFDNIKGCNIRVNVVKSLWQRIPTGYISSLKAIELCFRSKEGHLERATEELWAMKLGLKLLQERETIGSFWWPYMSNLPESEYFDVNPSRYSNDDYKLIVDGIEDIAARRYRQYKSDVNAYIRDKGTAVPYRGLTTEVWEKCIERSSSQKFKEKMVEEREEQTQQASSSSVAVNENDVVLKVLGERRGHRRAVGRVLRGTSRSHSSTTRLRDQHSTSESIQATNALKSKMETYMQQMNEFMTLLTSNLQSVMPGIQLPTPPPPPPLSPTHEEELDSSRDEDYLSDL
ncbi:Rubisco LS methyltransferase [Forsythia ovata]|uniref:Rubisco LS methyltransferase n=1 Tax=Forsythia ovata TaxID=205694 RepID=A0ABD1WPV6_9LAMI